MHRIQLSNLTHSAGQGRRINFQQVLILIILLYCAIIKRLVEIQYAVLKFSH